MSRGITEIDVWQASDALLLEGQRPTIERVRQKMGRGSPNTVSPYLDTWFRHLGGRIKDPGAFSAPPSLPDPVQQAAQHFWEVALAQTRLDFDARLTDALAGMRAEVGAALLRTRHSEEVASEASQRIERLQAQLSEKSAQFDAERMAHSAKSANLSDAQRQIEELVSRLRAAADEGAAMKEQTQREIAAADERAAGAQRRAALEIDAERTHRGKAEKRAEVVERKLEGAQALVLAERSQHVEALTKLQSALDPALQESSRLREAAAAATQRADELAVSAASASRRAEVAEARVAISERLLKQLSAGASALKARRKTIKRPSATEQR